MIKRILVALDGSELAEATLPFVEMLGKSGDVTVTLVRAIPQPPEEPLVQDNPRLLPYMVSMPVARPEADAETARNERYEAEHYLDGIASRLGQHNIAATSVVVIGDPNDVLVEEATARGADLIVLGTHGRSGLGRWIYGSVAEAVVARSPVPVFLARAWSSSRSPWATGTNSPILVPLDGSPRAEQAIPVAASLSLQLGLPLRLIQIVPIVEETALPEVDWSREMAGADTEEEEVAARGYLAELTNRLRKQGLQVTAGAEVDTIGEGILREARENQASLVVMATHAYAGLARALVRSVALEVLHRAATPVVLLGPAHGAASQKAAS